MTGPTTNNTATSKGSGAPAPGPLTPGGCGCGTEGGSKGFRLTARTCLELLPTLTELQLDREVKYLQQLDPAINIRTRFPSNKIKQELLYNSLTTSLCSEVDKLIDNYNSLLSNISCTLDNAQKHVEELKGNVTHDHVVTPTDTTPADHGNPKLEEPVSFLDLSFDNIDNITVDDILSSVDFKDTASGNRQTAYFGSNPYSYGRVRHEPADYPDLPVFDTIFNEIQKIDDTFNKDNFSCLINYYKDGNSHIPPHHDDEDSIKDGSLIYTVSVGGTRTIKYTNIVGRLDEKYYDLKHGSVFTMTSESQSCWLHGIGREPTITGPRISFTFRHTIPVPTKVEPKTDIPAISPPLINNTDNSQKRVLFLTDSMHLSTPTYLFDSVPNHTCIKKANFRLTDVFNFESEFAYTDVVIISCGINDLSRHGLTSNALADMVIQRLRDCCRKYPNTMFIFNTILLSKNHDWLNYEVHQFNRYMYNVSTEISNLHFFDSHNILKHSGIHRVWVPQGNGIHITLDARRLVIRELVGCVGMLADSRITKTSSYSTPHGPYRRRPR